MYRISRWHELYEPPARVAPRGDGPLRYVMQRVYGHSRSESYELLFRLAGQPMRGMAAFGLFLRLIEVAADEPRELRDGAIRYRGRPASAADIAVITQLAAEQVEDLLKLLCHQDIGWMEAADDAPATSMSPPATSTSQPATRRVTACDVDVPILYGNGNRSGTEQQQGACDIDVAGGPGGAGVDVLGELRKQGITSPMREALLRELPGLTVGMVAVLAESCRGAKNPAGVLVGKLRAEVPGLVRSAQLRLERERAYRAAALEQAREAETEQAELRAWIESRGDDELAELRAAVLVDPAIAPIHRDRWAKADLRANWGLMRALRAQAQKGVSCA